ncbi:uncharacterized protein LOC114123156 [Aphis gossypii]|uniref:Apolipophorin-III n=1 Tax=Aphis gossypii TaxID=80765 RepID=A0A9P0NHG8_APHGO|nr:uncharacterized protein LOC114123156 [Aphis gossypii]CAH1721534.1 unnamed protein product [Aphis gossypii]
MNGKIVLCFAVVFVGQALSAATGPAIDVEDFKKIGEQFTQSALSISNHILGLYPNSADAQKSIDKVKSLITKGISDIETEATKMKEIVRKNADPKLVEKYDDLEKEFKKQITDAKNIFDDKVGKPINEKYDVKKISENILKSTKDLETTVNKAIDGLKKQ